MQGELPANDAFLVAGEQLGLGVGGVGELKRKMEQGSQQLSIVLIYSE
jgi:hypothetical protein